MSFNRRDVILGLVIVVIIIAGALLYKNLKKDRVSATPTPVPTSITKNKIQEMFKYEIPDDVTYIELRDVSGGDGRGIATPSEILVDLPDPESGYFYQGWLEGGDKLVSLGKLRPAKGGWLLDYDARRYSEYKKVVVSLERVFDNSIEKRILEGTF